jgi:hypothetical protein
MNHPGENGSISEWHGNFSAYGRKPGQAVDHHLFVLEYPVPMGMAVDAD